jgi:hypothetical protein
MFAELPGAGDLQYEEIHYYNYTSKIVVTVSSTGIN